jgi:enolase
MATHRIAAVDALEILDSRGRPTMQVTVTLPDGTVGVAGVPAGVSTGSREAIEHRDHDPSRYGGFGVTDAVAATRGEIAARLTADRFDGLADIDAALIALDGTDGKRRLGSNALLGTSLACARALATHARTPLWRWLSTPDTTPRLPVPYFNVINGGAHAANRLDVQEFMLVPVGAPNFGHALRAGAEIHTALGRLLHSRGQHSGLGDEGGYAPDVTEIDALDLLVEAISAAGYTPGRDGVAIALDPAATGFYRDGSYQIADRAYTAQELIDWYESLVDRYPICSIEDGLAESDWDGWTALTSQLGGRIQLVGDDIFVTDPATITAAAGSGAGNAALIKPNQVGTVTETLAAIAAARAADFAQMISHRSGETTDTFIADLAVGCGCGQLKSGAPVRGERVAKYNRLLEIKHTEPSLDYGRPPHHWLTWR